MKRGYLYIAVTTLLFSSMEVALKLISGQFNPIQLNFSRFLVGGLVLIPFAVRELKKRGRKLDGKALGLFALLGLMGIAVSMSLYQLSVTRIQASVVGVLFSSNPVFVTLFAFLLLHETISKNQIAGLVLDVAGIVLIIQPWHLRLDALGVVYVLLATLLFALYGVCGKRQCARFGGIVVTCFGFLFGAAEMIAIAGLTHIPALSAGLTAAGLDTFASIPFFTGYTLTNLPIVLFIYIGVTGIGFTCYFLSMEITSAQTTSLVFFFKPALAPLLAFLVLHEAIPSNMLAGIACILCGSLVSILPGLLAQRRAAALPFAEDTVKESCYCLNRLIQRYTISTGGGIMNWNIRNDAPVYTQLVDQIARAIILGQFPPGSKLPSVRDFASDAGVNPNTMQRALAELERLELIRTQRTAGRTVTEDLARIDREKRRLAQAGIDAFWQALAQLGYDRAQALELLQQNLRQAKEEM